jgi:hypothetical protein
MGGFVMLIKKGGEYVRATEVGKGGYSVDECMLREESGYWFYF